MGNRDGLLYDPAKINWEARRRVENLTLDPTRLDAIEDHRRTTKSTRISALSGIVFAAISAVLLALTLVRVFS